MKKSKRHVSKFINHLFATYNVLRIPVYLHWHNDSVITDDMCGFGVFCCGDGENPFIHVACKRIGKTGVLYVIAHEFVHYLQYLHGFDMGNETASELSAEKFGQALLGQWLINKKDKQIRIEGTLEAWKEWRANDENA